MPALRAPESSKTKKDENILQNQDQPAPVLQYQSTGLQYSPLALGNLSGTAGTPSPSHPAVGLALITPVKNPAETRRFTSALCPHPNKAQLKQNTGHLQGSH